MSNRNSLARAGSIPYAALEAAAADRHPGGAFRERSMAVCGRFTLHAEPEALSDLLPECGGPPAEACVPRYNIAPSQEILVALTADGRRTWRRMRWGWKSRWKRPGAASALLINARAESAARKPTFRDAFRKARCLVPADGFFEWPRATRPARRAASKEKGGWLTGFEPAAGRPDTPPRGPWYFQLQDGAPFCMAGLWLSAGGGEEASDGCVLLTTTANTLVTPLHDRMPVILGRADHDLWLADGALAPERAEALWNPFDPGRMRAYPVSPAVNRPGYDRPEAVHPWPGAEHAG